MLLVVTLEVFLARFAHLHGNKFEASSLQLSDDFMNKAPLHSLGLSHDKRTLACLLATLLHLLRLGNTANATLAANVFFRCL